MYESAESLDLLKDITIDLEFESVCPPLTEDEFSHFRKKMQYVGIVSFFRPNGKFPFQLPL